MIKIISICLKSMNLIAEIVAKVLSMKLEENRNEFVFVDY